MSLLQTSSDTAIESAVGGRPRPFGSDIASQSRVYLVSLPFVLILFATAVWLVPTNATFVIGAAVGGLAGLYVLFDIVFRNTPLRLSTIYGMSVLLGYNLGAFNSWLTIPRAGLTLAEYFARNPTALARGVAACMLVAALLFAAGQVFERPVFGRKFFLRFEAGALPLIALSTVLLLGSYATGQITFMGINVDEAGHVNPGTALIMWWAVPAFAYSVCATLNTSGVTRWMIGACTILQGLALVPIGRRFFTFALLLAMVATRLGMYRLRMPFYKKLLIAVLGTALALTASVAFLYLRVAGWGQKGRLSLSARIGLALETAQKRSPLELVRLLGNDASTRTFTIGFFSDLLEASQHSTPLLGEDTLGNLQLAVPSILSVNKLGFTPYSEEELVNMRWGFAFIDEANSLLTAGAADFGVIGVLLYPLITAFLLRATLELLQYALPTRLAAIVALGFIFQTLQVESVPVAYVLQIRNAILVALVFYVFSRLPKFRLRAAP